MVIVKNVFIFFLGLLAALNVKANDSTLTKLRIDKINALSQELRSIPLPFFRTLSDSIHLIHAYKDIESRFFAPPLTSPDFKIYYSLALMHKLVKDSGMTSFKLLYPNPKIDSVVAVQEFTGYIQNTLIAYYRMYDEEWEMFYFAFKEGSDQLIYIIEAGGDPEWYYRKKYFLD